MVSGASGAQALADLSSALTVVATCLDDVAHTAVRGAARLIGDCAGIQVVGDDGVHAAVAAHYPDEERFDVLTRLHPERDQPDVFGPSAPGAGGQEWREALGGGPPRLLLHHPSRDQLQHLAPAVPVQLLDRVHASALLVCPLVVDDSYYGFLVLARTAPGEGYSTADVDLAAEVASRTAAAVATAVTVERLRASEERYRHIVETTLDGVWEIDENDATIFVNARMADLLGVPREELVGLSMRGFLDDPGQARLDKCRDGRSEVFDCRLIRVGEAPLWVQISATPLTGSAGLLCIVSDITERVAARDARRQLDQLRRQDAIGQLAGGIAHDFNNLLMLISGSAELLTEDLEPGSDDHRLASQIVTSAARGSELSHQLLTFGRRSPHVHKVIVTPLLEGVRQVLARAFGEQVTLEVRPEPDLWPIHADRGQLEQALVNLATNAREAMNRGGVITIAAANVVVREGDLDNAALAGHFVRLSVSDTGTGMDGDILSHAFDPCYTTKSARGAAGMGLATVRSIVTASGGHVVLESEPRIGTTVKLYLPVTDELSAAPPGVAAKATAPVGHILVVEDQPELAHLVRYLLQPAGYTVTIATDAADALSVLAAGLHPDLLLTDVVMPRMTGPELADKLRTSNPSLKVLYMSGYTAAVLAPQGHGEVGAALLQKPFNRHTLLNAVAKALGT
jgi:PAS domain S-box-containing protein